MHPTTKRRRNEVAISFIWFNPLFGDSVTSNIGKDFFINNGTTNIGKATMQGIIANRNKRVLNMSASEKKKKKRYPATAVIRHILLFMTFAAKNRSFVRHQWIHQMARQEHIMVAVKRISKHVVTIIFKASKSHPRETKQSSRSWFGTVRMLITVQP